MITIRNEEEKDRAEVEDVIRKAFWNLYIPGCNEHYLAHIMRSHPDFLPELDFVIELDGKIIGAQERADALIQEKISRRAKPDLHLVLTEKSLVRRRLRCSG